MAKRLKAPVCPGFQHNDSFLGSHRLAAGPLGYNGSKAAMDLIAQTDVVLALGTRLNPFSTLPGYGIDYWPKDASIIQVQMNPVRIGRTPHISHSVLQPARRCAWRKLVFPSTDWEMNIEIRQSDHPVKALAGVSASRNLVIRSPDGLFHNRNGGNRWLRPG